MITNNIKNKDTIKIIKHITKAKTGLSILSHCLIQDNTLLACNMEESLTIKNKSFKNLKEGIYTIASIESFFEQGIVLNPIGEHNIKDFPEIPIMKTDGKFFPFNLFAKVHTAVSNDTSQYTLNGVCLDHKNIVGIDGRRLHLVPHGIDGIDDSFIIPINACKIARFFKNGKIGFDNNHVFFKEDGIEYVSNFIQGEFPNYNMFIRKNSSHYVSFEVDNLLKVLSLLKSHLDSESNRLIFKINKNSLLTTSGKENSPVFELQSRSDIDDFEFSLNYKLLKDSLSICKKARIKVDFNDNKGSFIFTYSNQEPGYLQVLMPMKIPDTIECNFKNPVAINGKNKTNSLNILDLV